MQSHDSSHDGGWLEASVGSDGPGDADWQRAVAGLATLQQEVLGEYIERDEQAAADETLPDAERASHQERATRYRRELVRWQPRRRMTSRQRTTGSRPRRPGCVALPRSRARRAPRLSRAGPSAADDPDPGEAASLALTRSDRWGRCTRPLLELLEQVAA
jgi:hypothetical protein